MKKLLPYLFIGFITLGLTAQAYTTLFVDGGGTGWRNIQSKAILYGNGTSALATTTQGTSVQALGYDASGVPTPVGWGGYPSFSYATSTTFTGSSTRELGPAFVAETWNGAVCFTDTGTVNVQVGTGSASSTMIQASTTVGQITYTSNNTFAAKGKRYINFGPATGSTPTTFSCTFYITR